MKIRLGYHIAHRHEAPTPTVAMLSVHHSRVADLLAPDVMVTEPFVPYTSYRDGFGNWCHRFVAPAGEVALRAETVINDSGLPDLTPSYAYQHAVEELPEDTLVYLLGSRYCETDRLTQQAWDLFGHTMRGWALVEAVNEFVHQHIAFGYEWARPTRTAAEALEEGRGVCRDFAHLGVALMRAMNVPARYCTGYLGEIGIEPSGNPIDFSGWLEVYMSGQWITVDPRNLVPRKGRVLIARGRDAADVAMTTTFGMAELTRFEVVTEVLEP